MDWDDLKVLLALSRKGSARAAAQVLGVSNSTVTRRLDEMEHGTWLGDYRLIDTAAQAIVCINRDEVDAKRQFELG